MFTLDSHFIDSWVQIFRWVSNHFRAELDFIFFIAQDLTTIVLFIQFPSSHIHNMTARFHLCKSDHDKFDGKSIFAKKLRLNKFGERRSLSAETVMGFLFFLMCMGFNFCNIKNITTSLSHVIVP